MDEHEARYQRLLAEIHAEFPGFRLIVKSGAWSQRFIHRLLAVVTFGGQRRYLTDYQTTIGRTVYVTDDWHERPAADRYATMRHERAHLRQFRRWTRPGMAFLYIFGPLPVGLAWCRAQFEKAGYAETIRASAEIHGIEHVKREWFRRYVVNQFVTGSYGWMWPFRRSIERWYDRVVAELEPEAGKRQ